jgi:squalene-hopene/tetraprenyl-beta-curcumene cyclase
MRTRRLYIVLLLVLCMAGAGVWRAKRAHEATASAALSGSYSTSWNPTAAASYLDYRESWWQSWPPAQKDHGTVCISCHTVVPYALARPALQQAMGVAGIPAAERAMLDSVEMRVGHWSEMTPFYSDAVDGPGKTAESHATEAVLNAVILASVDAGQGQLRPITRTALDEAWALQETAGSNAGGWKWQDFNLAPWESAESGYQGAAMLAIAMGNAPDHYAADPSNSKHVQLLRDYLQRQYAAQPVMSQVYVLWASAQMPGLLNDAERTKLLARIRSLQQSDGGWPLSSLNDQTSWKRLISAPDSDGCATGLVVLALEESGVSRNDKVLARGLEWLEQHQSKDGSWRASSLNEKRDPESDIGRFMSDAATGYAVLALEIAQKGAH